MFCSKCGTELSPGAKFCKNCGAPVKTEEIKQKVVNKAAATIKSAAKQAVSAAISEVRASDTAGECMIGSTGHSAVSEILSPMKTVQQYGKSVIAGFKTVFTGKNKKSLIVFSAIALVWLLINILTACGINNGFLKFLSALTFANGGGLYRNVFGAVGGMLGKTVFAAALIGLLNGGAKYIGKGFENSMDFTAFADVKHLNFLILGAGVSLLLLKVFAGYVGRTDIMAPVASVLLILQAAGSKSGFLYDFISSLLRKNTNAEKAIRSLLTGLNLGFALGAVLAVIPRCGNVPFYSSIVLLIAGIVLSFVFTDKKAVKAS